MKVVTRDLISGFPSIVTRFSQVHKIIDRLENTPVNVHCKLRSFGDQVLNLADDTMGTVSPKMT